jgi:hypothetical protein
MILMSLKLTPMMIMTKRSKKKKHMLILGEAGEG